MSKCMICGKKGIYKIKNENIYYCQEHAEKFFSKDSLENLSLIREGSINAQFLKKFLNID